MHGAQAVLQGTGKWQGRLPVQNLSKFDLPAFPCGFGGLCRRWGWGTNINGVDFGATARHILNLLCNLIVNEGNTLLGTEEVEMLSVLRINRPAV